MPRQLRPAILLTIDVEDWFQVENLRPLFPPSTWNEYALRVEQNTCRLLDLFDAFSTISIKATFFILGWVAKKLPDLIREIHLRGHEVASHGYGHIMCNKLDPNDLTKDLVRSKHILEEIIGHKVTGYRAPNFSISDQTIGFIRRAGYEYDSSFNSFSRHGRYGQLSIEGLRKQGVAIKFANDFHELPISNMEILGQTLPWGGGGYFRFMPFSVFKMGVRKILKESDAYIFYLHPWEIDADQPRVKESKGLSNWRHYLNLEKTYSRLHQLIDSFKYYDFVTCNQYVETVNAFNAPPSTQ